MSCKILSLLTSLLRTLLLIVLPLLLAITQVSAQPPQRSEPFGPPGELELSPVALLDERIFDVVTVVEGLVEPWGFEVLPNGDILANEMRGRMVLIRKGSTVPVEVPGAPAVRYEGQGGLMDLRLAPDFERSRLVYMTLAKPGDNGNIGTTAVYRGRFDGESLNDVEQVFEAQVWGERNTHYGTRLVFDNAGHFFLTIADRSAPLEPDTLEIHPAQNPANHVGKILRLNLDGSVPADNPFVGQQGAAPEVWALGHRDPQGITFREATGDIWTTDHGPIGGDEINLIEAGNNYGWPVIGKGLYYDGTQMHKRQTDPEMEQPVYFWSPRIAPSSILFYSGDVFPEWQGDAIVGGLGSGRLTRLDFDGNRVIQEYIMLDDVGRIRDVRQGPDGFIYLAIIALGGAESPILRLEPR